MTYERVFKSIAHKPVKAARYKKFNKSKPRKFGRMLKRCRKCNRTGGMNHKYGLNYCRQCFREDAEKLGFRKYS
ncbi:MAG: 30S ribosomal protein S14 [Candidatus Aenigmarchaeota archaeon]|nr:30S ribosomal protein S14 [Candidatus Aenigmarchaeota archaeon]